jgi:hypothetical protein
LVSVAISDADSATCLTSEIYCKYGMDGWNVNLRLYEAIASQSG